MKKLAILLFTALASSQSLNKVQQSAISADRDLMIAQSKLRDSQDAVQDAMQKYRQAEQTYEAALHKLGSAMSAANADCGDGRRFDLRGTPPVCIAVQAPLSKVKM